MMKSQALLLIVAALSAYNAGIIWLVEIACYPLWPYVGRQEFYNYHGMWWHSIWGVIFVPAVLVLAGSIAMLWLRAPGVPGWSYWLGFALQVSVYLLTAVLWAPLQGHMATPEGGLVMPAYTKLMQTHWLRVAIITAYFFLTFWMLAQTAFKGQRAS